MSTHQMYQVEALCHRIVLIDRGRSVLYGPVDEIRRNFAANAIVVQGEGDFAGLSHVLEARREDGAWHLSLAKDADPQNVIKELADRSRSKIDRFERAEPSWDIFGSVVTATSRPGARKDATTLNPPGTAMAKTRFIARQEFAKKFVAAVSLTTFGCRYLS
jgi:ABC-2 type transport system ATP-binding protein